MMRVLAQHLMGRMKRASDSPYYLAYVGAISTAATATLTVPVEWIVVTTTLLNRRRWFGIAVYAAVNCTPF